MQGNYKKMESQNEILSHIGVLENNAMFSMFKDFLSIEIDSRKELILSSKNFDEFNIEKGFIKGLETAKVILGERLRDKNERDSQKG